MRTDKELWDIIKQFKEDYAKDTAVSSADDDSIISSILLDIKEERIRAIISRRLEHLKDADFFKLTRLYRTNATTQKKTNS